MNDQELDEFIKLNNDRIKIDLNTENLIHIRSICKSIIDTKNKINEHKPGSFVQAIVNNDFIGAVLKADRINSKCLELYAVLMYNF